MDAGLERLQASSYRLQAMSGLNIELYSCSKEKLHEFSDTKPAACSLQPAAKYRTLKKLILLNLLFFIILMLLFIAATFALGYAGKSYGTDGAIVFVLAIVIHLFLNYLIMHRQPGFNWKKGTAASVCIIAAYLMVLFH